MSESNIFSIISGQHFTISGKIVVSETYAGIPNLLVVLYDYDGDRTQLTDIVAAIRAINNRDPNATAIMRRLAVDNTNNPDRSITPDDFYYTLWNRLLGDRLGSVLTDPRGDFSLSFNTELFRRGDQERRPDLVLLVLAPEDSKENETSTIFPIPRLQRILHFSYEARIDSGKIESYVICIPQKTLEEHGIPIPGQLRDQHSLGERIAAYMKSSEDMVNIVRNARLERVKEEVQKQKSVKVATQEAFKNFHLSSLPESIRNEPTYFDSTKLFGAFPTSAHLDPDLWADVTRIIITGLGQLRSGHTVRLAFTNEERDEFVGGRTLNNFPVSDILPRISLMLIGPEVLSGKSLWETSKEMFAIRNRINGLIEFLRNDSGGGGGEEPEERSPPLVAQDYVNDEIKRTRDEDGNSIFGEMSSKERANQGQIMESVGTLSLSGGPADQVAYHDYSDLQIAFDNIWTEIFDKDLERLGKEGYEKMVQLKNKVSGELPIESPESVSNKDELNKVNEASSELERASTSVDRPPTAVRMLGIVSIEEWNILTDPEKDDVIVLCNEIAESVKKYNEDLEEYSGYGRTREARAREFDKLHKEEHVRDLYSKRNKIREIIGFARGRQSVQKSVQKLDNGYDARAELEKRLKSPHKFDIFLPNSVNFGLLVTYRQRWEPLNYQVGELVQTIPLAPKQTRKFSTKKVTKTKIARKEVENYVSRVKEESDEKTRADSEISKKAAMKTNFQASASGGGNLGIWNVSAKSQFGGDMQRASESKKSRLRESTLKAAKEFKEENKITVSTEKSTEFTEEFKDEITNPNDEISVTYLFYELQRRYRISEKIHNVTPVILVANDVPAPNEIDEDWLITHDWILKRAILDDSFKDDLINLKNNTSGNLSNVRFLEERVEANEERLAVEQNRLEDKRGELIREEINLTEFERENPKDQEVMQTKRETVDRKRSEVEALENNVVNELNALQQIRQELLKANEEKIKRDISLMRLQIHVKQNILYYMQKIWEMEPPDQRFYRLYNIEVPQFAASDDTTEIIEYVIPTEMQPQREIEYMINKMASKDVISTVTMPPPKLVELAGDEKPKKLVDVADLNNPLGFSGNYMVFPLKELNYLSLYMMLDYLDEPLGGLVDPDKFSNYTSEDVVAFMEHAVKSDRNFFTIKELEQVDKWLTKRKRLNRKESEEIIVPSDSLYIECLPGSKPILEDFKLAHRAIDAQKAALEKIRYGARLLKGDYEDPEVDKRIILNGKATTPVVDVDE